LSLAVHPGVIQTELSRNALPKIFKAIGEVLERGAVLI
jgi:hypothetical protein